MSIERCVKSHRVWQIFYQTTILALNALCGLDYYYRQKHMPSAEEAETEKYHTQIVHT